MALVLSTASIRIGSKKTVHKIKKSFFNRNKESILKYITNNPGCILPHIITDENISKGTVRYHIKKLEFDGKIIVKRMGKFVRFFVSSHAINDNEKLISSYIRNKTDRKLLLAIFRWRGITNQELSEQFHMKKSSTYRYLKKFVENHIVEFTVEGRNKKYYLNRDMETILIKYINNSVA